MRFCTIPADTVMRVEGRLDEASAHRFEDTWRQKVAPVRVIADLSGLVYISSAGIGSFVRAAKAFQDAGGEIVLCGLHGLVRDVFELTQIIHLFRVFELPESVKP